MPDEILGVAVMRYKIAAFSDKNLYEWNLFDLESGPMIILVGEQLQKIVLDDVSYAIF
jgi:hypothetical protein